MYSFSNSMFSSRSWYRTWNSAAYHHWDPRQTVSYEVFFSFLFFFGGSDISVVNRVVEEAKPLEDCELHAAEIIWACVNSLRQLDLHLTLYFVKHHLQKKKNTHAHRHTKGWYDKQWRKRRKKRKYVVTELFFFIIIDMPKPPNLFELWRIQAQIPQARLGSRS